MSRDIAPENSKSAVNRAGSRLASGTATPDDHSVIENWRAAHNYVLNTFQANLRIRAKKSGLRAPVQRIKRLGTIQNKLNRFPNMQFARMHDVVGCRVIFDNLDDLYDFRNNFNRSRFAHKRRVKLDANGLRSDYYNYIKTPKDSGYRGIHDVFEYRAKQSGKGKTSGGSRWNGLHIEIQYRSRVQHAWATAVEICDNFTDNHGKFSHAPDEYLRYFLLASEILARSHEPATTRQLEELPFKEIVAEFIALEETHGMLRTLRGIQPSQEQFQSDRHTLLIFDDKTDQVTVESFSDFRAAVGKYFEIEYANGGKTDVVLVAADDSESVRFGFKNYFSDAREFVSMMDEACQLNQ